MTSESINDALGKVRLMQELVIERQLFRGYSGPARAAGGVLALAGALALASPWVPRTVPAQLAGWAVVLALALALNYGALLGWFLGSAGARRRAIQLAPALDALPALALGAVLSLAVVLRGSPDLLFGIWMACYGLVHVPYRKSLPPANYGVGLFYLACGTACLLMPGVSFLDPLPMGLVFFTGETMGGLVFYWNNRRSPARPAPGACP